MHIYIRGVTIQLYPDRHGSSSIEDHCNDCQDLEVQGTKEKDAEKPKPLW